MRRLMQSVTAAGLAVAAVTTASPAQALTGAEIAMLAGSDREKILVEGAKKEGEVSFYTTLIADALRPVVEDFQKKYPYLKLATVRSDAGPMLQRIMTEVRSRAVHVDVADSDTAEAMKDGGLVQAFASPVLAEYPKEFVDPAGTWVTNRFSWQGIAWNTDQVKDSEAPQTWEALLDSRWKSKMVWNDSSATGAPRLITHLRKIWGEERTMDYLGKLQKQDIRTAPGSIRTVLDQVIAGEFAIGVSMAMHHIADSKEKGAPINGASPEPSITRGQTLHVIKGAPHPHAAMLFIDYFLSKDGGQLALRDAGYNAAHPAVDPLPIRRWIQPSKNGRKELFLPPEEDQVMRQKSQDIYKSLFK
jgi:iron(III) transport system substrate-binding protein